MQLQQQEQAKKLILEALKTGELTLEESTEILTNAGIKRSGSEAKAVSWSLCEQGLAKFTDCWTLQSTGEFVNTRVHLKKLALAFADEMTFVDIIDYGSWGLNPKRPFGNSGYSAKIDILQICEIEPSEVDEDGCPEYSEAQIKYADHLYRELLGDFLRKAIRSYCQR